MKSKMMKFSLTGLMIVAVLLAQPAFSADNQAIENLRQTGNAFAAVAENSMPAVVAIKVETMVSVNTSPFEDEFFERFFGRQFQIPEQRQKQQGQGSGFIIDKDGYILTNNHVVGDADKITVVLHDGREFDAKLIGAGDKTDVAVIKIEGKDLPVLKLGDSDEIRIGEWAIAVGNPFGLEASVTAGVVSAKGRQVSITEDGYSDFIQTDAAINPGNSGGPLLNIDGEAIGINTFILSQSGGYMGIGFAIPINMAKAVKDQLIATGTFTRGYLGVYMNNITPDMLEYFDLKDAKGVLITQVEEDSPADEAGLKAEDIIIGMNGKAIDNPESLRNMIAFVAPGTEIKLKIIRDNKEKTITAKIGIKPEKTGTVKFAQKLGLKVEEVTDDIAKKLGMDVKVGVAISEILPGTSAEIRGLKAGMVILSVNRLRVNSVEEFNNLINASEDSGRALVAFYDGRVRQYTVLSLEDEQ